MLIIEPVSIRVLGQGIGADSDFRSIGQTILIGVVRQRIGIEGHFLSVGQFVLIRIFEAWIGSRQGFILIGQTVSVDIRIEGILEPITVQILHLIEQGHRKA